MTDKPRGLARELAFSVVTIIVVPLGPVFVAGYWVNKYRKARSKKTKENDQCVEQIEVRQTEKSKKPKSKTMLVATVVVVAVTVVVKNKSRQLLRIRRSK